MKSCDLFDNDVYIPEVCDVINISLAELPAVLSIHDITQILLHVKHGPEIICCIAANFPDHFNDSMYNILFPLCLLEFYSYSFFFSFNNVKQSK